jgi:aryl-alcohol dehydrogenase-like predicted oxidoreductase
MHDIIASGKALYWGTSEWSADAVAQAWDIADRHHLHKPLMEQPQYNLFEREKVEREFLPLYEKFGLGLTTWSPLASGLLTGKYADGIPKGSRAALPGYGWLKDDVTNGDANRRVRELGVIATELGVTLAQLSIAWCASNPRVSTVITGASRVEQVRENLAALEVINRLTPEILARIDAIF